MSRAVAYFNCNKKISLGYIYELEKGAYTPSQDKLESLIDGYGLDKNQARYLQDLRMPPQDLTPDEELRQRVRTEAWFSAHLQDLQSRGMPAAYLTPLFTVIACNDLLRSVLPGIDEAGSILLWMFSPAAKELCAEWEVEAPRAVATAKGVLARYRDTEQAKALLRTLSGNSDFRQFWVENIDVSYERDSTDLKYFRVPGSDAVVGYSVTLTAVPGTSDMVVLNVIRKEGRAPRTLQRSRRAGQSSE
ncbi:hypothetical protein ACFYO1_02750 [Nocardia sp. NPDC006044]|uniref:MmyB family transcriptional regulator n=1 Tax=Nocardia sp. NPDC006044 TaxID=3364306 RepID=UPI00369EF8B4